MIDGFFISHFLTAGAFIIKYIGSLLSDGSSADLALLSFLLLLIEFLSWSNCKNGAKLMEPTVGVLFNSYIWHVWSFNVANLSELVRFLMNTQITMFKLYSDKLAQRPLISH